MGCRFSSARASSRYARLCGTCGCNPAAEEEQPLAGPVKGRFIFHRSVGQFVH